MCMQEFDPRELYISKYQRLNMPRLSNKSYKTLTKFGFVSPSFEKTPNQNKRTTTANYQPSMIAP